MNNDCNDFRNLGIAIKQQRIKQNYTREELSKKVGISKDYLSKIENKGQAPSLEVLRKIIQILNFSIDPYFQSTINLDKSIQHKKLEKLLYQYTPDELELINHMLEQGILFRENNN